MEEMRLASAGDDIKLWASDIGFSLIHSFNPHCNRNIASLSWNLEGIFLASSALEDEKVACTYMKNAVLTTVELPCGAGVQCTDFSSASRYLVCGGTEGVSVWDLKTKTLKKSFQEHKGPVTCVRFNWNNSYIVSGSETGEIILHNFLTGQSSSPLKAPNVQAIRQLEYSAFKKSMFSTASDDGAITLWDANTRRMLHSFRDTHVGPATGLAFSPINEMLMVSVGLDKRLICYDIQKKNVVKVIDAQSPLTCIDVMPDGATAAVGSTRGKVYIYDLRQGGSTPTHVFSAHKTSVHSVRFMPAGKSKSEDSSSGKISMSTSGNKRQLPSAPVVMQDITPSKTGQTSETHPISEAVSPVRLADVFSPATSHGNQSQHSKSASQFSMTGSQGDNSHADVFSPLTKGAAELSAVSQAAHRNSSLFSMPSFLEQNNSNVQSSPGGNTTHNNTSGVARTVAQRPLHSMDNFQGRTADPAPEHHSANFTAGHLSHLQHSGMVLSPLAGHLSHPQMSSSLQSSAVEPQVATGSQAQSSGSGVTFRPVNQGVVAPPSGTGQSGSLVSGAVDRSQASASPDSAAISGGEDGDGGLSPRRDPSHPASHAAHPVSARNNAPTAASPVDMGGASGAGATQREFLRSLVADAMEEVRDDLHHDIQGLHVSMLRQFHNFETEIQSTLSHYAEMNQKLLLYVRQLEEENRRLKKNY